MYAVGNNTRDVGNAVPIAYYDVAHNQCSSDRKAHHGSAIYLFGGPISVDSNKHDDTGDSTPYVYNEYMALYHVRGEQSGSATSYAKSIISMRIYYST